MSDKQRLRGDASTLVLLAIVVAVVLGGVLWLFYSTRNREAEAKEFVQAVATRLAFDYDKKVLDVHLAPEIQTRFPPSFRERMIGHLRELGVPSRDFEADGKVEFTNTFFEPHGQFRVHLQYPERTADLDLAISCPHGWWQIDYVNLSWDLPSADAPVPAELTLLPPPLPPSGN